MLHSSRRLALCGALAATLCLLGSGTALAAWVGGLAVTPQDAPTNLSAPQLTGTARDGTTLMTSQGTWDTAPETTYSTAWLRCPYDSSDVADCTPIEGAIFGMYGITAQDVGYRLRSLVTADDGIDTAQEPSDPSDIVAPQGTAAPNIFGGIVRGAVLTTDNGGWNDAPDLTYAYQWYRCGLAALTAADDSCEPISLATDETYTIVEADTSARLALSIGASRNGSLEATQYSATTDPLLPINLVAPAAPTGTARSSFTLTANAGNWDTDGLDYSYEWLRCGAIATTAADPSCAAIDDATGDSYELSLTDSGSRIGVRITASLNGGASDDAYSLLTTIIAPENSVAPSAPAGVVQNGQQLTVDHGTWTGSGQSYTYQWYRCSAASADLDDVSCQVINDATTDTLTLTADDVAMRVGVAVTATIDDSLSTTTNGALSAMIAPQVAGDTCSEGAWAAVESCTVDVTDRANVEGRGLSYTVSADGVQTLATEPSAPGGYTVTTAGETTVTFAVVDGTDVATTSFRVRIDEAPTAPTEVDCPTGWQSTEQVGCVIGGGSALSGLDDPPYGYEVSTRMDFEDPIESGRMGTYRAITVGEGTTHLRFRSVSATGLTSAWTSTTVTVDRTKPTTPTLSCNLEVDPIACTVTDTTDAAAGIDTNGYSYQLSHSRTFATVESESVGLSDSFSFILPDGGAWYIRASSSDQAVNQSAWSNIVTLSPDVTAPSVPELECPSPARVAQTCVASGSIDPEGDLADPAYEYQYTLDPDFLAGITSSSTSGSFIVPDPDGEGTWHVRARAKDASGNASIWRATTVVIDTTAPTMPDVSCAVTWQSANPGCSFSGSTDAGTGIGSPAYEYQYAATDDFDEVIGTGTTDEAFTFPSDSDGIWFVRARALDGIGNSSDWTEATQAKVDQTAPNVPILSSTRCVNNVWTGTSSCDLAADTSTDAASGVASYELEVYDTDGSEWVAADATNTGNAIVSDATGAWATVTLDGETQVRARSCDAATPANCSDWTVTFVVRIDHTAPTDPTISCPLGLQLTADIDCTVADSTDDGGGLAVTPYSYTASTSPAFTTTLASGTTTGVISLTNLPSGTVYVRAKAIDKAGNVSGWVSTSVETDTAGPFAPILTTTPRGATNQTSATFEWQLVEAEGLVECTIDDVAIDPCIQPVVLTDLSEGFHTFRIRQTDTHGNVGDWGNATWLIDTIPPAVPTLVSGPGALINDPTPTIDVTGEPLDEMLYECAIDAGTYSACTSPWTTSTLSDGAHTLKIRQLDLAENAGPSLTVTTTVDTVAPAAPTVSGAPSGTTTARTATLTLTKETGAALTCTLNLSPISGCASPLQLTGLSLGDHTVAVWQTDAAGNQSATTTVQWTIVAVDTPGTPGPTPTPSPTPGTDTGSTPGPDTGSTPTPPKEINRLKIGDGAIATTKLEIVLKITPPANAKKMMFSREPSFKTAMPRKIVKKLKLKLKKMAGPQSFYVIFFDAGGKKVGGLSTATVSYDRTPPKLKSATIVDGNLVVTATEVGSRLFCVAWAMSKPTKGQKPTVVPYAESLDLAGVRPQWVKVCDGASNWSKWVPVS